jgi:hypothetical protein
MATILIGLDDTDNPTSRGTGYLARRLSADLAARGLAPLGVTRHQFLVDERIPYTSHNSGACVAVEGDGGAAAVAFAFDFVAAGSADGSDPGVCVAEARAVGPETVVFGRDATRRIVEMEEAFDVARAVGVDLRALGGSGLGVIGALGSVALRAEGDEGRFIDLPGLRQLQPRVTVSALARLGVRIEQRSDDRPAHSDDVLETLGWVRPRLVGGQAVLPVQWSDERDAWVPVDRKRADASRGRADG